ncbi:radical SAM protein [Fumia xinanensis]|uniref:Radical SAM protein n=1 Tax=Fumia xinanensis TaxID=2763659 RepID=A0A926E488_9FIRM|nr:radical SAM protein [Fumia xinanensis]MBC8559263.1 radical SAM protein [Fumia xinanensis]
MSDYKLSKFNYYVEYSEKFVLLLNKLSKQTAIMENTKLDNIESGIYSIENLEREIESGFVVSNQIDEDLLANENLEKSLHSNVLSLTILTSESCNFKCAYCFDEFNNGNIKEHTMEEIILYVRKNIHKYSALHVEWFGGEPLLALNSIYYLSEKLIDICKKASRQYFASTTTNGYLLGFNEFKMLHKYKVYEYIVTLDGLAAIHNKNRPLKNGEGSFDKIIDNLRSIRDKINSKSFKITIRTNLTKEAYGQFESYIEFLNQEFGGDSRFTFMFNPVYDWGGERVDQIKDNLLDDICDFYNIIAKKGEKLNLSAMLNRATNRLCYYAGRNIYTITTEGGIIICPQLNKGRIGYLNNGKMEIAPYKLASWYALEATMDPKCQDCQDYYLCKGKRCPANIKAIKEAGLLPEGFGCEKDAEELDAILPLVYKTNPELFIKL